ARKTTTSFPFLSPRKAIDEPRLSNLQSAIPGAVEVVNSREGKSYEFGGWESSFWGTRRRLEPRLLFQDLVAS
ncbi:hypothetical protein LINPERPRIM_LOCUS21151, partial [Linum perenne]